MCLGESDQKTSGLLTAKIRTENYLEQLSKKNFIERKKSQMKIVLGLNIFNI